MITGIGPKTSIVLVVLTGRFDWFTSVAELCSFGL